MFAQRIVAWNVAPTKAVELVDVALRMALWQRVRVGHPVVRGELIGHAGAGSQYTSITFPEHLVEEALSPRVASWAAVLGSQLIARGQAVCRTRKR